MTALLEDTTETLNSLLRFEYDTIAIYKDALKFRHDRTTTSLLRSICDEHSQAAEILRVLSEEPQLVGSRLRTGFFSPFHTPFAERSTHAEILHRLEEREHETVLEYGQAADIDGLDGELAEILSGLLLPQSQVHLQEIERLAALSNNLITERV